MSDLPNVQYAPDVLFNNSPPVTNGSKTQLVVISVVDISKHTNDSSIVQWYYKLILDSIKMFNKEGFL